MFCLGLVGCTASVNTRGRIIPAQALEGTRSTPSKTLLPTNSVTPLPSKTPEPSSTPVPTLTFTPTASPTALPTPSPTRPACWSRGGKIVTGELRTKLQPLPVDYRIYLPPCYDQQPDRRYPVLYLFHGQNNYADQWDRLGADETADALIAAGEVSPFIIVMPHDRYGGQPTEDNFGRILVEELLPYIDSTYRTIPDREHRAAGGLSRGAGWSVNMGISHWDLFGIMGAHSPAVFHTDAQKMRTWLDAIPPDKYPRIFVDVGDKDRPEIMDCALWFEQLLNLKNIPHEWYLFTGYHEEAYWHAHIEMYLRWYAKDW